MSKLKGLTRVFLFSVLTLNIFFSAKSTEAKLPDNPNNPNDSKYKLSEREARDRIYNALGQKFGSIRKYSIRLIWPFITEKFADGVKLANNELREIRNIAEENLKSDLCAKRVAARKAFVTYISQIMRKPIEKKTIKWIEYQTQVPVTNFKDVERKRYDEEKLKQSIYSKIIESISKKSYDYTLEKTGKANIADKIQKYITNELWQKIKLEGTSLKGFLGKLRWKKLDQLIENIVKRGSPDKK